MKVVVTGGAGFIGSHLVDALLAVGHEVVVVDDLSTGKRERVNPKAAFHQISILDGAALTPLFLSADAVFHCAALARITFSMEHPRESHEANVDGTLSVLLAARDAKVRRVIYSASSSAYGDQPLPLVETMTPHPMNLYALQKFVGEEYCRLFASLYGMQTVSLRYFNVYGPRMNTEGAYATVIGAFIKAKAEGRPLPIDGDGEQTRDFTHVSDVVKANMLAMTASTVGRGELINIGSAEQHSVNEIARAFGGPTETRPPRPEGSEARHVRADITWARELLKWTPTVPFQTGLQELIKAGV